MRKIIVGMVLAVAALLMMMTACGQAEKEAQGESSVFPSANEGDSFEKGDIIPEDSPVQSEGSTGDHENMPIDVDIFEKMQVFVSGINGYASLRVNVFEHSNTSIDTSTFLKEVYGSTWNMPGSLYDEDERKYAEWFELFDIEVVGENQKLSNGDQVRIRVTVHSALEKEGHTIETVTRGLNIRLNKTEMLYTVSGAEDGVVIDIFSMIDEYASFKGATGDGYLEYNIPTDFVRQVGECYVIKNNVLEPVGSYMFSVICDNIVLAEFYVKIDSKSNLIGGKLKSGDSITVSVSGDTSFACQDKTHIVVSEKQYIVPQLGEYLTSIEDITEETEREIREHLEALLMEKRGEGRYSILDIYVGEVKPTVAIKGLHEKIKIVVYYKYNGFFGEDTELLSISEGNKGLYRKADGSLSFPENDYNPFVSTTVYGLNDDYTWYQLVSEN